MYKIVTLILVLAIGGVLGWDIAQYRFMAQLIPTSAAVSWTEAASNMTFDNVPDVSNVNPQSAATVNVLQPATGVVQRPYRDLRPTKRAT